MKKNLMKQAVALTLAILTLGTSAFALFGKKQAEAVAGAPIAREVSITTYRGIPVQGQFLASDSEGDDMTYAVVQQPRKGTVTIDGVDFTYTPKDKAAGGDSFTYTATDSAGHVSAPATVTVTIEKTKSGVTYADMAGSKAAVAAQHLAEAGVFTGVQMGGKHYFQPDETVSRSEFLVMALKTAGREVTAVTMTGFCDDAVIPTWAKAYAAAGAADGIVCGKPTAAGAAFRGEEPITFNQAATILDRMLNLGDVELDVWYADRAAVPSWAAQAVGNMEAVSVLSVGSFGSAAMAEPVTRADAAQMLSAVKTLLEGEEDAGWFGWLK